MSFSQADFQDVSGKEKINVTKHHMPIVKHSGGFMMLRAGISFFKSLWCFYTLICITIFFFFFKVELFYIDFFSQLLFISLQFKVTMEIYPFYLRFFKASLVFIPKVRKRTDVLHRV